MKITVFDQIIPINVIQNQEQLIEAIAKFNESKILAIDTEFDEMRIGYGLNLQILQLFDQKEVYIVQVSKLKDIQLLKPILENPKILKLIWAAEKDVQVIKTKHINLQGLYDLQIASWLLGFGLGSYAAFVERTTGIKLDKKNQLANWGSKILNEKLIRYAANDVVYSFHLYKFLLEQVKKNNKEGELKAKNEAIERMQPSEVKVILTSRDQLLSPKDQSRMFKLRELRDKIAKRRKVAWHRVFPEALLDEIVSAGNSFQCITALKNCLPLYKDFPNERTGINRKIKEIMSGK